MVMRYIIAFIEAVNIYIAFLIIFFYSYNILLFSFYYQNIAINIY